MTRRRPTQTPKRSRFGCRNCKMRKLKCDESRPACQRCTLFGIICNYMLNVPDFQPVCGTESFPGPRHIPRLLTNAVWSSDASSCYHLDARCQDLIYRYLGHSLMTPDDPALAQLNRNLLRLAFAHPFLMHASLAVAMAYDRSLCHTSPTVQECHHYSLATSLFRSRLQKPISPHDRDPIWGTAAALATMAYATPTADDSRPLQSSKPLNLDWLRVSNGKMSLWEVVNPLREDSIFSSMDAAFADMLAPLPERGVDGIPEALAAVCQLSSISTKVTSPYFEAAHAVSQLLAIPDAEVTTGSTQLFPRIVRGRFEECLVDRDPVALLLLYLWFDKAGRSVWWIGLRARVECPAIWTYLSRRHRDNGPLQALLSEFPVTES